MKKQMILMALCVASFATHAVTEKKVERIPVTSGISVSGDYLCQDGQKVFFKKMATCFLANESLPTSSADYFPCKKTLEIAPISELEIITTDAQLSLQRFFRVPTEYKVEHQIPFITDNSMSFFTVRQETKTLPICEGMKKRPSTHFLVDRYTDETVESLLIHEFLENEIYVVNKPQGKIHTPDKWEIKKSPLLKLNSQQDLLKKFRIQTPHCNNRLNSDTIRSMLGGWHGGGGSSKTIEDEALQSASKPLKVNRIIDDKTWKNILENKTDYSGPIFDMTCL